VERLGALGRYQILGTGIGARVSNSGLRTKATAVALKLRLPSSHADVAKITSLLTTG
jgi:hypothetical protein